MTVKDSFHVFYLTHAALLCNYNLSGATGQRQASGSHVGAGRSLLRPCRSLWMDVPTGQDDGPEHGCSAATAVGGTGHAEAQEPAARAWRLLPTCRAVGLRLSLHRAALRSQEEASCLWHK